MTVDKLSLTLFDILSYLLPGYIVVFTLSIAEATFLRSDLLSFSTIKDNWLALSVVAYFLGQFSHRIASFINNKRPSWFNDPTQRLGNSIYYHIRNLFSDMHSIEFKDGERLHSLETYLLADSYVIASGNTAERDSLIAREGFNKTSMVTFAIITITVLITLFKGGTRIQLASGDYYTFSIVGTLLVFVVLVLMTWAFWRGYAFYNRLKINNTLFLAMTLRTLDKERLGKVNNVPTD